MGTDGALRLIEPPLDEAALLVKAEGWNFKRSLRVDLWRSTPKQDALLLSNYRARLGWRRPVWMRNGN